MKKLVPSTFIAIGVTGTANHVFFKGKQQLEPADSLLLTLIFASVLAITFVTLLPCVKK